MSSRCATSGAAPDWRRRVWDPIRAELFANVSPWAAVERGEMTYADFVAELRRRVLEAGGDVTAEDAANFMGNQSEDAAGQRLRPEIVDAAARIRKRAPHRAADQQCRRVAG